MKTLITIILVIFSHSIIAATGIIRVLEVPLQHKEDDNSVILQKKRMGERIHIHDSSLTSDSDYYVTLSRDGLRAYVKKEYIKIIRNNIDELSEPVAHKNDPTDYRIDEPMPEGYPFKTDSTNKATMYFSYASATPNSYEYSDAITREQYSPILSFSLKYLRNPKFDVTDRVYYGFILGGQTEKNEFQISNNIYTEEENLKLFIGSSFQYTFYRRRHFEIDIGIDALLNYNRSFIGQQNLTNSTYEEILFTGNFLSARANVFFVHKDSFGKRSFDLIHGPNLVVNSAYTLTASRAPEIKELWPSNQVNVDMDISFGYLFGFTVRY